MRYILVIVCLLITLNSNGQEKRLAWVIGNSNYEKGFLKNPVNDALLVAKTLKELNFTVLLDTNIATEKDFNDAVRKFGEQRSNFNIGFIYYAGHGIQIKDVNYLLPTKEDYLDEYDVEDKALSVQKIMRYIEDRSSEVNVLILDACRDNPFEKTWKATGRSLEGSRGLAKANPPTGSLIAYSTDAGNIAADGTGKNSIYCLSLVKNMQIENLTLDQVFRNVRTEVLKLSDGKQRPVEASQLTGEAFYLKKGTYLEQINVIDSLIDKENYTLALQEVSSILTHDATNKMALCRKGQILVNIQGKKYNGNDFFNVIKLYPNDPEPIDYLGRYYYYLGEYEKALSEFEKAINLDSLYVNAYFHRTGVYESTKQINKALMDYNKLIELKPQNPVYYFYRASFYKNYKEEFQNALVDYSTAIQLDSLERSYWYNRGLLYQYNLNNNSKALEDYKKMLSLDSSDVYAINVIGLLFEKEGEISKAIETYEKGISLEFKSPQSAAYCYNNRAKIYAKLNLLDKANLDFSKAISLDPYNSDLYAFRADFYENDKNDFSNALMDYSKAIELYPSNIQYWLRRGYMYLDKLSNNVKALEDFNKILEIDSTNIDAINAIGIVYKKDGNYQNAILTYNSGIILENINPKSAAYCYRNRAEIYLEQNLLDKAFADYNKAISLDPNNAERYYDRGVFYSDYREDYQSAMIDFSKAIELNPTNCTYWYSRGLLYKDYIKKFESALKDFNKAIEIDSTYVKAYNEIGLIYLNNSQNSKARQYFEKGISFEKMDPQSSVNSYTNRARLFESQDSLYNAFLDYCKAIQIDQFNPSSYIDRGIFYRDYKNDYANALIDFSIAIELNPGDINSWYFRGHLYKVYLHENEKALEDFKKIIQIDSTYISAINWMGVIYEDQNKLDKAIEIYEKGIKLSVIDPAAAAYCYRNRASIYTKKNKLDSALLDLNQAIKIDSYNYLRYSERSFFYRDYLKDFEKSLNDITKAIELKTNDVELLYSRAYLYMNYLKNYDKAFADFIKILELDSTNLNAINGIGLIYQLKEDYNQAINIYDKGISLEETNPKLSAFCYRNRANIYIKQNLLDLALMDFNKAIFLDPTNPERYIDRANFYKKNKSQYYDALVNYTIAISLDSTNNYNWSQRAQLLSDNLNNHIGAINDSKQIINRDSNETVILNWIGVFYDRIGDKDNAIKYYKQTISKVNCHFEDSLWQYSNGIAWSYNNLAEEFRRRLLLDSATIYYSIAIQFDPKAPERHYIRGLHYANYLGNKIEAEKDYNKAIELDIKNPIWHYYKSRFQVNNQSEKEGFISINKAIELSEKKSFYIAERGNYYRVFKKYDLAQKDFNEALKLDSNLASTYHYQILLLKDKTQIEEAIKYAEQTIAKFKNDTVANYLLGDIYLEQKDYLKSLKYFSNALAIMEYDSTYQTQDQEVKMVYLSNAYQKVGEVYQLLGDKELPKEYYAKALIALKDEIRPDKLLKEKELQDLLKQ